MKFQLASSFGVGAVAALSLLLGQWNLFCDAAFSPAPHNQGFTHPSKGRGGMFGIRKKSSSTQHQKLIIVEEESTMRPNSFGLSSWNNHCLRRRHVTPRKMSEDDTTSSGGPLGIIIAGAPASGKGTQCEMIKETFGVIHLSTGDMLRAAVADGTPVGKLAKDYMDAGKLVPDEVIIGIVKERLNQNDCQTNGWLLDGFPRTKAQADALAECGVTADCFIFLNVPDDVLVERVVGRRTDPDTGKIYHMTFSPPDDEDVTSRLVQRSDDTEEKVKVRLEQFHKNVDAVSGCYESISMEIDGTAAPSDVAALISEGISKLCGTKIASA